MTFEDDLLALEQRVLVDAAGDFLKAVDELRQMLLVKSTGVQGKLARLAIPRIEAAARSGIAEGFIMGSTRGLESLPPQVGKPVENKAAKAVEVAPDGLFDPVRGLDRLVQDSKRSSLLLIRNGAAADVALAPVFRAATATRAIIETQINAASNTAALLVGEAAGVPMVWEAERDACVHCLALAGEVVEQAGDEFPLVSYDTVPKSFASVQAPPRHPHCRCQLAVLGDASYADALKREAQRSILRGFALPTESNAVRVRAAARLLDRNPVAPKSVKAYAAKAVRDGKFPRGRDVPTGGPRLVVDGVSR